MEGEKEKKKKKTLKRPRNIMQHRREDGGWRMLPYLIAFEMIFIYIYYFDMFYMLHLFLNLNNYTSGTDSISFSNLMF